MPNRILRDGILSSERVSRLSFAAEVFYRRLMSLVDDYGRYMANTVLLRSMCYPLTTDRVAVDDISTWLGECEDAGLIHSYEVDGKSYLELKDFRQQARSASKFPGPDGEMSEAKQGRIYFIQAGESKRIKIGYSEWNPDKRLNALQTGSAERLTLIGVRGGTLRDERQLHRRFASDLVGGEWFNASPELMRFIETECNPPKVDEIKKSQLNTKADSDAKTVCVDDIVERMYARHPKLQNRPLVEAECMKLLREGGSELLERVERVHQGWCNSEEWKRENGKYVSTLDKWLHDRAWMREAPRSDVRTMPTMRDAWESPQVAPYPSGPSYARQASISLSHLAISAS